MLASLILALALAAPARAQTPPGTCAMIYPAHAIPGDAAHQAFAIRMTIAPGRTANMHYHPAAEYMTVSSGSGWLEVAGKPRVTLSPGHVYMIPPNVPHRAHNTGKSALLWTSFFVGKAGDKSHTFLVSHNMKSWTPGCATHF